MAFSPKSLLPRSMRGEGPVIPVIRLSGAIGVVAAMRSGLSISSLAAPLEKAFAMRASPAVAIVINSPGGSAVQSHLIYKRIRDLAVEKGKRVIVFVEDVAASGGYMIALAGDEIVVDRSSIVGSIGVVFAGFGFQKLIDKIGVERRVHTAGQSKAMLDPFQPEKPDDVARLNELQREVHESFIELVKSRRGAALVETPDLFSGAFWSGQRALALGLVDKVGDLRAVLRERYGDKVTLYPIQLQRGFLRRLGLQSREGTSMSVLDGAIGLIEERLLSSRFGL
jgi:serine protease SohB